MSPTDAPTGDTRDMHPACTVCKTPIARLETIIDPRLCTSVMRAQCGHDVDSKTAGNLWRRGYRWTIPLIDGAALIGAERVRQVDEEGYTAEHDAEHGPGDGGLPWAAWSYIDRAMNPTEVPTGPPTMWPWGEAAWKADATPVRHLVIAGALIAAEIDRRLHAARASGGVT